jgi:hypothetical protein
VGRKNLNAIVFSRSAKRLLLHQRGERYNSRILLGKASQLYKSLEMPAWQQKVDAFQAQGIRLNVFVGDMPVRTRTVSSRLVFGAIRGDNGRSASGTETRHGPVPE